MKIILQKLCNALKDNEKRIYEKHNYRNTVDIYVDKIDLALSSTGKNARFQRVKFLALSHSKIFFGNTRILTRKACSDTLFALWRCRKLSVPRFKPCRSGEYRDPLILTEAAPKGKRHSRPSAQRIALPHRPSYVITCSEQPPPVRAYYMYTDSAHARRAACVSAAIAFPSRDRVFRAAILLGPLLTRIADGSSTLAPLPRRASTTLSRLLVNVAASANGVWAECVCTAEDRIISVREISFPEKKVPGTSVVYVQ